MSAVTEKQAAGMWCPMVRESGPDNRTIWNRTGEDHHDRCLGSRCMAWRWATDIERRVLRPGAYREPGTPEPVEHRQALGVPDGWTWEIDADAQDGCHWLEPEEQAVPRRRGYCGLAGKP